MMTTDLLLQRAKRLKLYGVVNRWKDIEQTHWIEELIAMEEEERSRRSLERRLNSARIGRFKPLTEFDWHWPKKCDRELIEDLMTLDFMKEAINLIFCGPNGVGKSTFAKNSPQLTRIRSTNTAIESKSGSTASMA